jgi:hypothetical protein
MTHVESRVSGAAGQLGEQLEAEPVNSSETPSRVLY